MFTKNIWLQQVGDFICCLGRSVNHKIITVTFTRSECITFYAIGPMPNSISIADKRRLKLNDARLLTYQLSKFTKFADDSRRTNYVRILLFSGFERLKYVTTTAKE